MKLKKVLSLLLCAVLVLGLGACTKDAGSTDEGGEDAADRSETEELTEEYAPEELEISIEEQLQIIADAREEWLETSEDYVGIAQYAVTDLDEDGALELVRTWCEGTGIFSESSFWEVDTENRELVPIKYDFEADSSGPDFVGDIQYRCFRLDDVNYYIVNDSIHLGAWENYYIQDVLWLQDGEMKVQSLAYCMVLAVNEPGDGVYMYFYTDEAEEPDLEADGFVAAADTYFGIEADRRIANFGWEQFAEGAAAKDAAVLQGLTRSQKAFGFTRDSAAFQQLAIDPTQYYDEPIYFYGDTAIQLPAEVYGDWYLWQVATQFEARYALEDGMEGELSINPGGYVYLSHNDPADARGAMVLADMQAQVADGRGEEEVDSIPVEFMTLDGLNRFIAVYNPEDDSLDVTWYWWSAEDPGTDPAITTLRYLHGVG